VARDDHEQQRKRKNDAPQCDHSPTLSRARVNEGPTKTELAGRADT
jgi:hypothetical protein